MYFPKILRTPFYKHLCFLTPLDGFSCNVISNNVKARWSVKCWLQKFCNILCSTFKYLYLSLIFYKFRQFAKTVFTFLLCVNVALLGDFFPRKTHKIKWSNCYLNRVGKVLFSYFTRKRVGNSLKLRQMAGYVKHWKVENFLHSQPSLSHEK